MDSRKATQVTREGMERLSAELKELIEVRRPELVAAVAEARSHGDLRENAAYDAARQDQGMNERRIAELESMLQNVVVVEPTEGNTSGIVRIGSKVTVDFGDGELEEYTLVGAIEAKPSANMISNESPLGKALTGKRIGDTTYFFSPGGQQQVKIKDVR
ncbi:MAG TPA: transcription elongation factor GreA [Thermomicrobiales bacterium]|jgi:transcription elongation factor GreA|nr:transcription elongation factor GreA [Thermomicrobiales bacterium]